MASTNLINCDSRAGNTGVGRCTQGADVEQSAFLVPAGTIIDAAFLSDIKTNLAAKLHHNDYDERWHLLPTWREIIPQDAETETFTYADGSKTDTREGYYSTRYRYLPDDCMHSSLRQFNGREQQFDILAVDASNRFIVVNTEVSGIPTLKSVALSRIHAPNKMKPTHSEPGGYFIEFDMADATEYNESYATVLCQDKFGKTFNPITFAKGQGVQDVAITPTNALTSGVVTLLFGAGCGQISLGLTSTITAAMLDVKNKATGAAITITSLAAAAAGNGLMVLTLDTGDADYPTSGNQLTIAFKSVSTLTAAGLSYYESNVLTLTV